jgi:hypothetical protein
MVGALMALTPLRLQSSPGVMRDTTRLNSEFCTDAQWTRFDPMPRKMWGYDMLTNGLVGIARSMHGQAKNGYSYIHMGGANNLQRIALAAATGSTGAPLDRTPAALVSHADNLWSMCAIQDTVTGDHDLFAHAAPNGINIDSETETAVWSGELTDNGVLTALGTPLSISGGIWAVHPYLMYGSNDGKIGWSVAGEPNDISSAGSGEGWIASQKVITGRQMKGAIGYSPAGLIWSLDRVYRQAFTGGATVWSFDELGEATLMSAASIIEKDGMFFWPSLYGFEMYNGSLRDLPNKQNLEWFHDRLNWAYRGRMYGFLNHRWNELWWCFPRDEATECNHAIICNLSGAQPYWYDTPLPGAGRAAAVALATYRYPLMTGVDVIADTGTYRLWQHEYGLDECEGATSNAIQSYFITPPITLLKGQEPSGKAIEIEKVEPDIEQTGDVTMTLYSNANARSDARETESETFTITEDAADGSEEIVPTRHVGRQVHFKFESNTQGGDLQMGATYVHLKPADDGETT